MNLQHLRYVVEVAKTASISQAADNLYMSQPNLSRAIRELETELGTELFSRTSKGIRLTSEGEVFIDHAHSILAQLAEMESLYKKADGAENSFYLAVPRANYIISAYADFVSSLPIDSKLDLEYIETSPAEAISKVTDSGFHLAIIRYPLSYDSHYASLFEEKNLHYEPVLEFSHVAVFSKHSPLASIDNFTLADLRDLIELSHMDPSVPKAKQRFEDRELTPHPRRARLCDRGSQMDLLSMVPTTYMWVSPLPKSTLDRYGLIQKECVSYPRRYLDVLIWRKNHRLSQMEENFVRYLMRHKNLLSHRTT